MKYICPGYIRACFQIRNERMVDYSARGHRGVQWRERWHQKHHILCYPAGRDCSRSRSGPGTSWISTHTPHAGRDDKYINKQAHQQISTHTPHAGRDTAAELDRIAERIFQLTRPMRGVTSGKFDKYGSAMISTHTPHAGRDRCLQCARSTTLQFQLTRPMRGVTRHNGAVWHICRYFNSHAPCGA